MPNERTPLTYGKIEDGLRSNMDRMELLTDQYATAGDVLAKTEADFKVAYARARLEARASETKVTEAKADDIAIVLTEQLRIDYEVAKAKHEALKQALYTCRERRASLQSLMASHRTATESL